MHAPSLIPGESDTTAPETVNGTAALPAARCPLPAARCPGDSATLLPPESPEHRPAAPAGAPRAAAALPVRRRARPYAPANRERSALLSILPTALRGSSPP
ncbi:hypothetical protein GCM10023224_36600 [Streptomonospora halophila]|uniref:Uncharacterized protein n=1 Tax=Streptomonospora halophila TaxID=427369 RepID=A0ABP9GPG1_9ACTN